MWIALGIIGFLAALITVIILLPVKVILKNNEQDGFILRYKFLGKIYGEEPDPNNPIIKALKVSSGLDRLSKENISQSIRTDGLPQGISESYDVLKDLLKEVWRLLKLCRISRLRITIRTTGKDAAQAAIHYGEACAVTHAFLSFLQYYFRIRKRDYKVDIACDFFGDQPVFYFDMILSTYVGRVLKGLWRTVMAEAKRMRAQQTGQTK